MPRTAALARTTSEPSGSGAPGPSASRFPVAMPCRTRTEHIAGSQATIAPLLTCRAAQAAAWARTDAAWVTSAAAEVTAGRSEEATCGALKPWVASTARTAAPAATAPGTPIRPVVGELVAFEKAVDEQSPLVGVGVSEEGARFRGGGEGAD